MDLDKSLYKITLSDCETSPRISGNLIGSTFLCFIDVLILPGVMPLMHHHYQSQPHFQDYPSLLVQFSRYFDLSEKLVLSILQQVLNISNPHLLFRNDDLNIQILREFTIQTASGLPKLLQPILKSLRVRRLSQKRLNQITFRVLQTLCDYQIPLELNRFYSLLKKSLTHNYPGAENIGLSSLFFLRFLNPLILNFFLHDALLNTELYRENSTQVAKLIQSLANDTLEVPSGHDGCSPKKGRQNIKGFLARLSTSDRDPSYSPLPTSAPSVSSAYRFFQLISQEANSISQLFASIGSLAPDDLEIKWSQVIDASMQVVGLLSQHTPRSMDKFIFAIDSTFSTDSLTTFNSTSSSSSFTQKDLPLTEPNDSIESLASYHDPSVFNSPSSSQSMRSKTLVLCDPIDSIPEHLLLLSVPCSMPLEFPALFPSSEQIESWDNSMVLKWLEINKLAEAIPSFAEQGVRGYDLLHGSFRTPQFPDDIKDRFIDVYNQLQRNSLSVFNSTFRTPEEHIKALQAVIYKMMMILNSKTSLYQGNE